MTRAALAFAVLVSTGCTYVTIAPEAPHDAGLLVDASDSPDGGSIDVDGSTMHADASEPSDAGHDATIELIDAGSDSGSTIDDAGADGGEDDAGPACGLTCRELGCGTGYLCVGIPCPICRPVCSLSGEPGCPEGTTCVPQSYSEPGEGICV